MKIKSINIKNFKSIVDITINEPNPFTVFVGPNGSGKSNIFEALEFLHLSSYNNQNNVLRLFGGEKEIINSNKFEENKAPVDFKNYVQISYIDDVLSYHLFRSTYNGINYFGINQYATPPEYISNFNKIFINHKRANRVNYTDDAKLNSNCDNLEKVLKRILQNPVLREEILDYLRMLIPELENIEIVTDEIDGDSKLRIYEKFSKKPFNKALISDGTYNILCLLTAVYQSEEPQFLCIEEPENGLSPYAIETLVGLVRSHCQDYGHYIWLNTHSQTLVRNLKPEEFILVDKIEGETKIKQFKNEDLEGWRMDEAWLTNALGGGLPW